jgi:hypothetical protein
VSSAVAACGLVLTAWQMVRTRRVADLQALQKFFESANQHEAALARSGDDAQMQTHVFNEFLNFLEVYASAHNKKLFGKGGEAMVRQPANPHTRPSRDFHMCKARTPSVRTATNAARESEVFNTPEFTRAIYDALSEFARNVDNGTWRALSAAA